MVRKEVRRMFRIWTQTFVPSLITTALYFLIFGSVIGSQVGPVGGVSYMVFITPGLILMSVMTAAFTQVVFSFYMAKFQRNLEEVLVAPVSPLTIVAAYITSGFVRAFVIALITLLVVVYFVDIPFTHPLTLIAFTLGTSLLFALGGLLNAIYAKKFDDLSIFITFILTPLTYFGGVFYSISVLPPVWQTLSQYNPILYLINGFRYGFLGISDTSIVASHAVMWGGCIVLTLWIYILFKQGRGLKL